MDLNDKLVAIVTGGASGLGEATVRLLRERGARVAILDYDAERGKQIAEELGCHFSQVDVSDDENVAAAFAAARAAQGQERLLVNCAGTAVASRTAKPNRKTGAVDRMRPQDIMPNVNVNLVGSLLCASHAAAGMIESEPAGDDAERGLIIHVASTEAMEGNIGFAAYSASKGGVVSMTLPMARDLQDFGIRVNTILPGFFRTGPKMIGSGPQAEAVHEKLIGLALFPKRAGQPGEFAKLVGHLAENVYINGATIRIDAGHRLS
ncbi:MAG: SDR family NAD(P)-dependent oxidoreductase [Sphingomonadales bacterium]|nr:MAG: SDR family NAD(P)-dependent oxidoreductase [Sphingomonadales bacterium]